MTKVLRIFGVVLPYSSKSAGAHRPCPAPASRKTSRTGGMLQLLGIVAIVSGPANAMQLQVSGTNPYLCAVVQDGNTASGTSVIAYPCSGGPEDQWNLVDGQFQGIGTANGKSMCLDLQGGAAVPGTPAVISACNGGFSQQWTVTTSLFSPDANVLYDEAASPALFCLDSIGGPPVGGGTQLVLNYCNNGASQNWILRGLQLTSPSAPYQCANVQDSKTANGTPVLAYSCDDAPNEVWSFQNGQIVGTGTENGTTKCLVAASSSGGRVSLTACSSTTPNSHWGLTPQPYTPSIYLNSGSASYCLDRAGGPKVGGGTQLVLNSCSSSAASQNWILR